jgi:hypothetical protein
LKKRPVWCIPCSQGSCVLRLRRDSGAHPKELAWIVVKSKKKNDKADSLKKIAKLHMSGMLPESHLLDPEEQVKRDLLVQRVKMGNEIGRLKNSIISYLKREGVYHRLPPSTDNFSDKRRKAISSLKLNDDRDLVLRTMTDRLDFLEGQCDPIEDRIKQHTPSRATMTSEAAHEHRRRGLLPGIPSVFVHRRRQQVPDR